MVPIKMLGLYRVVLQSLHSIEGHKGLEILLCNQVLSSFWSLPSTTGGKAVECDKGALEGLADVVGGRRGTRAEGADGGLVSGEHSAAAGIGA